MPHIPRCLYCVGMVFEREWCLCILCVLVCSVVFAVMNVCVCLCVHACAFDEVSVCIHMR